MSQLTHKLITRFLFKKPFYGKSKINESRLNFLSCLLEKIIYENVQGEIIEVGVYRGGSLVKLAQKLKEIGSNKKITAIDTFEGLPYSDEGTIMQKGYFSDTDYNKVMETLNRLKLDNVNLIKANFKDVCGRYAQNKFAFVHLDVDLYQSYKECLNFFLPRMSPSGVIWFDDYNSNSALKANKAIEEFIKKEDLVILPRKQAYYIKNED